MFGKTFIYKRLDTTKGGVTEHTCHAHDFLHFLEQLNNWNRASATNTSGKFWWIYWTEEIQK